MTCPVMNYILQLKALFLIPSRLEFQEMAHRYIESIHKGIIKQPASSTAYVNGKPKFFYGYAIVASAFITMSVVWGTVQSFGLFFKPVLNEFGWSRAATSGAFSLSFLVFGILSMAASRLTDRFGPRLVTMACGVFLGLGYILMSQITAIWQLYVLYGIMIGIGMGTCYVPLASTVARWFVKKRGLMTGIFAAGLGVGSVIVPPVASMLIESYSWRTAYVILGIVAMVMIIVTAQFLRRDPSEMKLLPYGEKSAESKSNLNPTGYTLKRALRTKQLWMLVLIFACFGFSQQAILVHIVPYATDIGISAIMAATLLSIIGGLHVAGKIGIGGTCDRIGSRPALILSLTLLVIALTLLPFAKQIWMFYFFAIIFGFAYGGMGCLDSPSVAEFFGMKAHGAILGVIVASWAVGATIGPVVVGHLFDAYNSYYLAFWIIAAIAVAGTIFASLPKLARVKFAKIPATSRQAETVQKRA